MIRRLATRALANFNAWRTRRREAKAAAALSRRIAASTPEIARLRQEIEQRSRRHRKVEPLRRQLRDLVIVQLAKEQGRSSQKRIVR